MKYDLRGVCGSFDLRGEYVIGVPFGTGHINDTFAVTFDQSGTRGPLHRAAGQYECVQAAGTADGEL